MLSFCKKIFIVYFLTTLPNIFSSPNVSRIKFNLYVYVHIHLVMMFLISEKDSGISRLNYLVVDAVL
jgi:hypothetical protein